MKGSRRMAKHNLRKQVRKQHTKEPKWPKWVEATLAPAVDTRVKDGEHHDQGEHETNSDHNEAEPAGKDYRAKVEDYVEDDYLPEDHHAGEGDLCPKDECTTDECTKDECTKDEHTEDEVEVASAEDEHTEDEVEVASAEDESAEEESAEDLTVCDSDGKKWLVHDDLKPGENPAIGAPFPSFAQRMPPGTPKAEAEYWDACWGLVRPTCWFWPPEERERRRALLGVSHSMMAQLEHFLVKQAAYQLYLFGPGE